MNEKITEVTQSPKNDKKMQNVCIFHLIQHKMCELKKNDAYIAIDNQIQRYNSELKSTIRQSRLANKKK